MRLYNSDEESRLLALQTKIYEWTKNRYGDHERADDFATKSRVIHRLRVALLAHVNTKVALENLICELQIFSIGKLRQES